MTNCKHPKEIYSVRVEICPTCEPELAKAMPRSRGLQLAAIIRKVDWGDGEELPVHVVRAADLLASYLGYANPPPKTGTPT